MGRIARIPTTAAVWSLLRIVPTSIVVGGLLLSVTPAYASATPEQKCQAAKNKTAGQYVACRQNAEATFAATGNGVKYGAALTKCETKFTSAWQKAIAKAAKVNVTCLDASLTDVDFQTILDQSTTDIATALAGGGLEDCSGDLSTCNENFATCTTDLTTANGSLSTCSGNLGTCNASLTTCNGNFATCTTDLTTANGSLSTCNVSLTTCNGNLATCTMDLASCTGGAPQGQPLKTGQTTCLDTAGAAIPCAGTGQDGELQKGLTRAYTDNGDGTITDTRTGLMWEKLSDDGTLHDKDNFYLWSDAFAVKVAGLNGGAGFAGHTDWRVPNANELQSLVNFGASHPATSPAFNTACTGGCTVTTCSCTDSDYYWSSTSDLTSPSYAWVVYFGYGFTSENVKSSSGNHVRGVRGGS